MSYPDRSVSMAAHFVAMFARHSKKTTVPLSWIKTVAERTSAALQGEPRPCWIAESDVLAALIAAGFRVRVDRSGKALVFVERFAVDSKAVVTTQPKERTR